MYEVLEKVYLRVTEPNYEVTIDDLMDIARLRNCFVSKWSLVTTVDIAVVKQRMREIQGGMKCSPVHFLHMANSKATKAQLQEITSEFQNLSKKLNAVETPGRLIFPVNNTEEALRTLSYMFCLLSIKEGRHVVEQQPWPVN